MLGTIHNSKVQNNVRQKTKETKCLWNPTQTKLSKPPELELSKGNKYSFKNSLSQSLFYIF